MRAWAVLCIAVVGNAAAVPAAGLLPLAAVPAAGLLPLAAVPAQQLSSRWELSEGMTLWWSLGIGEARLRVRHEASNSGLLESRLAFEAPWLAFGQLEESGLLRELSDPLGAAPGSGALAERSALRPGSALDGAAGASVAIGQPGGPGLLFGRALAGGTLEAGVLAGRWDGRPLGLEGAIVASRPPPGVCPDAWIVQKAPWPGGTVLHAAARAALRAQGSFPPASLLLTAGASGCRFAPMGGFLIGAMHVGTRALGADAVAAVASPDYRNPCGETLPLAASCGLRLRARGAIGSAEASYASALERPPPVGGACLPTTQEASMSVARRWALSNGARVDVRLAARSRVEVQADGSVESAGTASLRGRIAAGRAALGMEARFGGDGVGVRLDGSFGGLAVKAALTALDSAPVAGVELKVRRSLLGLTLGIDGIPVGAAGAAAGARAAPVPRLGIEWSAGVSRGD
jgi:hypothetical protein